MTDCMTYRSKLTPQIYVSTKDGQRYQSNNKWKSRAGLMALSFIKPTIVDVGEKTIDTPVIGKAQQTNSKTNSRIFWYYSLP